MGHQVKYRIYSEWVSPLLGKFMEKVIVLAFALPAVAVIAVMHGNHHDAPFIVKNRADMHVNAGLRLPTPTVVGTFAGMPLVSDAVILAANALADVGRL